MVDILEKFKFWETNEDSEDMSMEKFNSLSQQLDSVQNSMEEIERYWKQAIRDGKRTDRFFYQMKDCLKMERGIMKELNKFGEIHGMGEEEMTPLDTKAEEIRNITENETKIELLDDLLSEMGDDLSEYEEGYLQAISHIINAKPSPFTQACHDCPLRDDKSSRPCELARKYDFCWINVIRESPERVFERVRFRKDGFSLISSFERKFDKDLNVEDW